MHITLLGLGSLLMQDEGVGVHTVRYIQENFETPGLEIIDGGTAAWTSCLHRESGPPPGGGRGEFRERAGLYRCAAQRGDSGLFGVKASLHHLGLADVLAAAS